jgi:MFS family permease
VILEVSTDGFGLYVELLHSVISAPVLTIPKILGNLLALAAVCPFVGSLSDLFGRRYVCIGGASLVCLGVIIASTAKSMNTFIGIVLPIET